MKKKKAIEMVLQILDRYEDKDILEIVRNNHISYVKADWQMYEEMCAQLEYNEKIARKLNEESTHNT